MSGSKKPILIAHRGESFLAPENSMPAFELAWENGAEAIELDVRLTADESVICSHDADTHRVTGGATKLVVEESTLAALQALDVSNGKGAQYAGTRMPLLGEVLAAMPKNTRVLVEIKTKGLDAVAATIEAIARSQVPVEAIDMISFHAPTVEAFKSAWMAGPKAQLLVAFKEENGKWSPSAEQLIEMARACRADALNIQDQPVVDHALVQHVHEAGYACNVWTVDDPVRARELINIGVDAITTNRRAWLREQLRL
jgi:glycerophosphoryl diester phosphodiesterase